MSAIEIHDLGKAYGRTPVLRSLSLSVPEASLTAVLGPSGSGKTTLLRIIAGFEDADSGRVSIGGQLVDDGQRTVRAQHRGVGYVPQDAALFPHLTVAANIGFGVARRQRRDLAELIELVGLAGYENRYPHQLSGGQQQRVALARALAINPRVVLLDEPFGSLDAALRESVRADVAAILRQTGTTAVLVTHDQDEALSLADTVVLIDDGRVLVQGDPRELYAHPSSPEIAVAIGTANILDGQLVDGGVRCALGTVPIGIGGSIANGSVANGAGTVVDATPAAGIGTGGGSCRLLLRPEQIAIDTTARAGAVPAAVDRIRYHGHDTLIDLTARGEQDQALIARVTGDTRLRPGQSVWLTAAASPHLWLA